ncbi:MAG: gas vesicle protein GvpO, partial [Planctomycetota bacterium]
AGDVWRITIEITEKPSPAPNLEILGIYEVRLNDNGNFIGYERLKMRKRGDIQRTSNENS